jgi:hypothetical protein
MAGMIAKEILTTGQAARELGVTPLTVSRWCQAAHAGGTSPLRRDECFRPGRDWKIRRLAVSRLLGEVSHSETAV